MGNENSSLLEKLEKLQSEGVLQPFEYAYASFLQRLHPKIKTPVLMAALLAVRQARGGHVCVELGDYGPETLLFEGIEDIDELENYHGYELNHWLEELKASPLIDDTGEEDKKPLVLDGKNGRLYVRRYWQYEKQLSEQVLAMVGDEKLEIADPKRAHEALNWFDSPNSEEVNWQKIAALTALLKSFSVITGGPGTGKTTTVLNILAMLQQQSQAENRKLKVALAAPTGKAAARLSDSIRDGKKRLVEKGVDASLLEIIPDKASTIHRMLGYRRYSPYFRHNRENPLPYDVVVVDEASMIDLPLMAKLVDAIPPQSRFILLGDKDQLASVEAGRVLGDLCGTGQLNSFSPAFVETLQSRGEKIPDEYVDGKSGLLQDAIVELMHTWRFNREEGIGRLSELLKARAGAGESFWELLKNDPSGKVTWLKSDNDDEQALGERWQQLLQNAVDQYYRKLGDCRHPKKLFDLFSQFQILCALRRGPFGVEEINRFVEQQLVPGQNTLRNYYHGKPVMVTENDYGTGLFNGDIGFIVGLDYLEDSLRKSIAVNSESGYLVCFETGRRDESGEMGYRWVGPERLPDYETAYATTVHKSQGSEFDEVLFVLPEKVVPILTKELFYTAVTRAREKVSIWGSRKIIQKTVEATIRRSSGLRERLWGEEEVHDDTQNSSTKKPGSTTKGQLDLGF